MSAPGQFADELRLLAGRLAQEAERLQEAARGAQWEADERDELLREVA